MALLLHAFPSAVQPAVQEQHRWLPLVLPPSCLLLLRVVLLQYNLVMLATALLTAGLVARGEAEEALGQYGEVG